MANTVIGRVVATEKNPTTIDNFTFWTDPELILNPFDIVKVQHVNNSFSYGVIEDIAQITDAASFLTNFISSDFGDVNAEENTLRVGMNYVSAKVVCNTENIYIPLQSNAKVMLATAEEINYALGLNDIRNPLVCGYLEMYDGTKGCEKVTLPVNLNSKFIIGPEGAHLNISGISGLASKTSYAMFLLKAIQDSYMKKGPQNDDSEDSVAFVLFNVKGKDLLAIDQVNDFSDERNPEQARNETFAKYEQLGLSAEPFKNVHYYYPYSLPKTRHWNTYMTPEEVADNIKKKKAKKYKYIYKYDKDNLDLMFANIDDSTQTMESIISYIMSGQGNQIINEIRDCGFGVGATYTPPNEYEIMINNLKDSYNDRAYIRKAISIYREIMAKLKDSAEKTELYLALETAHCLYYYTASKEDILGLDEYVRPLYEKTHKPSKRKRIVDFNQGIDSRLITEANIKKLSEVNIQPLRIAFDHWNLRDIYEKSVRIAVKSGIKSLSNYLLYNFEDKPEELYYRLRLNVDLCEELGASIYSFPMKYHPINDKEFFMNRDYIGKHWNRKFIRAVQAVLNSTKGKIGRGVDFFEEAFGRDIDEFIKILWMPETFIIYRRIYDADLRSRLSGKYTTVTMHDCDLANEWWEKFRSLPPQKLELAKSIIALNKFKSDDISCNDKEILEVLSYYTITRDEAEA